MANLTAKGEVFVLKLLKGDYSAGVTGFDKIGIYGSIDGAADSLIGAVQAITWGFTVGNASLYILGSDPVFNIAKPTSQTIVKGVLLFNTVEGVTFGDELAKSVYPTPYVYNAAGTHTIDTLTYNFDRID